MKLSTILKKTTKVVGKANVEKLEKNQLEKVTGGTDTTVVSGTTKVDTQKLDSVLNLIR
jgi:heptaprenylglyceryl phosphate synthase